MDNKPIKFDLPKEGDENWNWDEPPADPVIVTIDSIPRGLADPYNIFRHEKVPFGTTQEVSLNGLYKNATRNLAVYVKPNKKRVTKAAKKSRNEMRKASRRKNRKS